MGDLLNVFRPTFRIQDAAEKKAKQEEAAAGPLIPYLKGLETLAERNGSNGHFVGSSTSVADIKLTTILGFLVGDFVPGFSASVLDPYPNIVAIKAKHEKN